MMKHTRIFSRGFTLIELLTVTAIIVVVTAVVLANNNRFGGVVLLENLAYDVALSIRQAQVYGISVARFGPSTFNAGYGIDFNLSSPNVYLLFADAVVPNGLYDCPSPGTSNCELVKTMAISSGYSIKSLCVTPSSGTETCSGVSRVDILFERPEPDAWISAKGVSCILNTATCETAARIVVASPRGDNMSVVVDANGQISVQQGTTLAP